MLPLTEPLMFSGRLGKCSMNFWGSLPVNFSRSCLPNCAKRRSFILPGFFSSKASKSMSASVMMFESAVLRVISGSLMWL